MAPPTRPVQRASPQTMDVHCHNMTRLLLSLTANLSSSPSGSARATENDLWFATTLPPGATTGLDGENRGETEASQRQALLYIVVVLFFYSFGIGFMMIRYMRQEAKEQEECKMYRRYGTCMHLSAACTCRVKFCNRMAAASFLSVIIR